MGWFNLVSWQRRKLEKLYTKLGLQSRLIQLEDGTTIHCWVPDAAEHKEKPRLILVQGFAGDGMSGWENQVPDLCKYFALYVPDLIFFGKSTTNCSQRSEAFQAHCMLQLLRKQEVKEVFVVGTSYGGMVAFQMAHLDPQLVKKVVIASSGVCMDPSSNDATLKEFNAAHIHEVLLPTSVKVQKKVILYCVYKQPSNFIEDFFITLYVKNLMEVFGNNREKQIELLEGMVTGKADAPPLPKLTQDVLILWGSHDRIFNPELAHELKEHLGEKARLIFIEQTGHVPQIEKSKEFNSHVVSFLAPQVKTHTH